MKTFEFMNDNYKYIIQLDGCKPVINNLPYKIYYCGLNSGIITYRIDERDNCTFVYFDVWAQEFINN